MLASIGNGRGRSSATPERVSIDKRHGTALMTFQPPGEIELEQDREDMRSLQPGVANDLVDPDRRLAESFGDAGAILVSRRRDR